MNQQHIKDAASQDFRIIQQIFDKIRYKKHIENGFVNYILSLKSQKRGANVKDHTCYRWCSCKNYKKNPSASPANRTIK